MLYTQHMQDTNSKEKTLIKVRRAAIGVFYFLLCGGTLLIGLGAAVREGHYWTEGTVILIVSPIFLVLSMLAKRKLKDLGI